MKCQLLIVLWSLPYYPGRLGKNHQGHAAGNGKGKIALDKLSCKTATSFFVNKKFVVPTAEKWLKKASLDEQTIRQILYYLLTSLITLVFLIFNSK